MVVERALAAPTEGGSLNALEEERRLWRTGGVVGFQQARTKWRGEINFWKGGYEAKPVKWYADELKRESGQTHSADWI